MVLIRFLRLQAPGKSPSTSFMPTLMFVPCDHPGCAPWVMVTVIPGSALWMNMVPSGLTMPLATHCGPAGPGDPCGPGEP